MVWVGQSSLCQVFVETIQAARPAVMMPVARRDRLERRLVQGELRLRTLLGEAHRHQHSVTGLPSASTQVQVQTSRSGSTISWYTPCNPVVGRRPGAEPARLLLCELGIHPEDFPVVAVEVVEAPPVHESVFLRVHGVLPTSGDGFLHHLVHCRAPRSAAAPHAAWAG